MTEIILPPHIAIYIGGGYEEVAGPLMHHKDSSNEFASSSFYTRLQLPLSYSIKCALAFNGTVHVRIALNMYIRKNFTCVWAEHYPITLILKFNIRQYCRKFPKYS